MIDGLKPYPAYKPSGVPWLGDVPEHWKVERLKSRVINYVEQISDLKFNEPYIALEHVESWTGRLKQIETNAVFDSQVKRFSAYGFSSAALLSAKPVFGIMLPSNKCAERWTGL